MLRMILVRLVGVVHLRLIMHDPFHAIRTLEHCRAIIRISNLIVVLVPDGSLPLKRHWAMNFINRCCFAESEGLCQHAHFFRKGLEFSAQGTDVRRLLEASV